MSLLVEEIGRHPNCQDVRTPTQMAAGDLLVFVRVQELANPAVVLRTLLWGTDSGAAYAMKCDLNQIHQRVF